MRNTIKCTQCMQFVVSCVKRKSAVTLNSTIHRLHRYEDELALFHQGTPIKMRNVGWSDCRWIQNIIGLGLFSHHLNFNLEKWYGNTGNNINIFQYRLINFRILKRSYIFKCPVTIIDWSASRDKWFFSVII